MNNIKWLRRKYPKTFTEVSLFLNDEQLKTFKEYKYKLGRLVADVGEYKSGKLIMFKRSNPVNDYNYPLHYGVIKCNVGETASGYHSINIVDGQFIEVNA